MAVNFSRSIRQLDADGPRRAGIFFVGLLAVLFLWCVWLTNARVSVYATTGIARLEVTQENHPVDAPVVGRISASHLVAGQRVNAGDVLLELDANPERLAQTEARAKLAPSAEQLHSLKDELLAEERAIDVEQRSAVAANIEALARAKEIALSAELAVEEAKRLSELQLRGLVSDLDNLRGSKVAEQRQSEAQAAESAVQRLMRDLAAKQEDRRGRIARLKGEIAQIEGGRNEAVAASERLEYQIDQRQVRARIGGIVAEVASLKVGEMVQAGDRICTIVPDGDLKVVAMFRPSVALGRIRSGQLARVHLEGFPWTQYGSAEASVTNVSGEVRDGQVRVDLALRIAPDSAIPFQHGLPAEVQVEVERASPAALVLRSIGRQLHVSAASPDHR